MSDYYGSEAIATFKHADGSTTVIVLDQDSGYANPRDNDGNVATLIQTNNRYHDIDSDDEGLADVRDRFSVYDERPNPNGWSSIGYYDTYIRRGAESKLDGEDMVRRFVAMFCPNVLYYTDHWSADGSAGWGYVTRADWDRAMAPEGEHAPLTYTYEGGTVTPESAFDQEVDIYGQWARGDVYGYVHVGVDGDEIDSCWGFLGYDNLRQIAEQATDSPITEES